MKKFNKIYALFITISSRLILNNFFIFFYCSINFFSNVYAISNIYYEKKSKHSDVIRTNNFLNSSKSCLFKILDNSLYGISIIKQFELAVISNNDYSSLKK